MLTPLQSIDLRGTAGDPLPPAFKALEAKGTRIYRGQLALIAAAPGGAKSAFTLAYALKARVPTLYFSADSDAFTQSTRILSMELGWPLEQSARAVRTKQLPEQTLTWNPGPGNPNGIPIRLNYAAQPTLKTIENSLAGYEETFGNHPQMVVVDNITNVLTGVAANDEDPFGGLEVLMDYLHETARETGAAVIGLHHVTGDYNDGDKPIPLRGVKGQIARVPELILTLHRVPSTYGGDSLRVSTVKNRAGRADASGREYAELEFVGKTMTIRDFQ
ncbi:AAA family ATPase [Mycolicibacterium houstonense]|uniref:AAA family ATPase n=1 Tax=Mycolicibacterium houstonense TaxID=146021 RepID=UPI00083085EA|nr:AAA family ATPase [Mycolicibacterium houstonense]